MDKLFTYALAIAVCVGTTALLTNNGRAARQEQSADAPLAADGAFRDGVYVGRLAAEAGRPLPPQGGRGASGRDRVSFAAGYGGGGGESTGKRSGGWAVRGE